jgi:hypothetical protein
MNLTAVGGGTSANLRASSLQSRKAGAPSWRGGAPHVGMPANCASAPEALVVNAVSPVGIRITLNNADDLQQDSSLFVH